MLSFDDDIARKKATADTAEQPKRSANGGDQQAENNERFPDGIHQETLGAEWVRRNLRGRPTTAC